MGTQGTQTPKDLPELQIQKHNPDNIINLSTNILNKAEKISFLKVLTLSQLHTKNT